MLGIHRLRALVAIAAALQTPETPTLHGTVVSAESREPLGFSIVTLMPGGRRQFTDSAGRFSFVDTPSGRYVLSVRQIGYAPLDTPIVVTAERTTGLQLSIRHLAIELPPVTISANRCIEPGPPDSSDAALYAVFAQLQENARRFELLADSYPFRFTLSVVTREVSLRGDTSLPEHQQIQLPSDDHHPYHVGRVVERAWGPWGSPDSFVVIRSAELRDLGNAEFIASHCFHLAGRDTIEGHALVRIDFDPAERIGSADMAGAAYLDPDTYELRYTETMLTKPYQSLLRDVTSMTFRTRFRNIARGVPLEDSLTAITTYGFSRERRAKIDTQRTVEVRFQRQPPPP